MAACLQEQHHYHATHSQLLAWIKHTLTPTKAITVSSHNCLGHSDLNPQHATCDYSHDQSFGQNVPLQELLSATEFSVRLV